MYNLVAWPKKIHILAVLSTAFCSVMFPTVIWLYTEQPMEVLSRWLY